MRSIGYLPTILGTDSFKCKPPQSGCGRNIIDRDVSVATFVDGDSDVLSVTRDGEGWRLKIKPPASINHLIASKGSIAINGVSLTVNEIDAEGFGVLIIPHTWSVTTLFRLKAGDKVNLEADMMARYAARLIEARST